MKKKPIYIDCNKNSDGYILRVNPKSFDEVKSKLAVGSVTIYYDWDPEGTKVPSLNKLQWKAICKLLLGIDRLVPCMVVDCLTRKVYFRSDIK